MSRIRTKTDAPLSNMENNHVLIRQKAIVQPTAAEKRRVFRDVGNQKALEPLKKSQTTSVKTVQGMVKNPTAVAERRKVEGQKKKVLEKVISYEIPKIRISEEELLQLEKIDLSTDPQLVSEYINDIYNYLRDLEVKHSIQKDFLIGHRSTSKMRAVLVNWLVDVHRNFKMVLETLHITVAIIDRFLQKHKEVGKETLQLVGATALFIAAKYEEIYAPDISDFVFICDNTFSRKEILQMEIEIMKTLNFEFSRPISLHFLRRFNRVCQASQEHHSLGKYLLELALLNYDMSHVRPSLQAAAACCLANGILDDASNPSQGWNKTLAHFSHYSYEDINGVLGKMACVLCNAEVSKQQAVRIKYSVAKYDKISLHTKLRSSLVRKVVASALTTNNK